MELPEMNVEYSWKVIAAVVVGIAVIGAIIYSVSTSGPVNAYFEKNGINSGSETNLIVDVTNNQNEDVKTLSIQVTPIDPNSVTVENPVQEGSNIGKGEKRIFKFPITIGDVRPGTYSLEIEVKLGSETIKKRAMIEIK